MCLITLVCSLVLGISIPADPSPKADSVLVIKSERKLKLIRAGEIVREYSIALGSRPVGHKWQEGDDRTPEGYYVLDWRNPASRFYRSIHVSYPDDTDESYARMA